MHTNITPKTVYLVRHGEPEEGFTKRFIGRLDPALSPNGLAQARHIATRIAPLKPERCLSSPLRRARETAGVIAAFCGLEVEFSDLLLEIHYGLLEGKTYEEAAAIYPVIADSWRTLSSDFSFPEGEDFTSFNRRVKSLADRVRAAGEKKLLLVAHGGLLRGLLCNLLDIDAKGPVRFQFAYASLSAVKIHADGGATLDAFNVGGMPGR